MHRVPAPIDHDRVRAVLGATLGASRTLPAEAYLLGGRLRLGAASLLRGIVGLRRAGRRRLAERRRPAGGPQSATRASCSSGAPTAILRAFSNMCRHRGHELLEPGETRSLRAIKCPYHAWVYSLEGELAGAPRFGDVVGFRKEDFPLIADPTWRSGTAGCSSTPSGDAPPFEEHVGNLDELVAPWEPERLVVAETHDYVIAANWKGITENYHECYHCPSIHPALCTVTPIDSGANFAHDGAWVGGSMELMEHAETMSLSGESLGVPIRGLDRSTAARGLLLRLFPNLLLSLHPDYVMTHRIEPLGPASTRVECSWLFPPEALERDGFSPAYATEFWDLTNREDWRACESVQRGLASRGPDRGRSRGARTRSTRSWRWSPTAT